MFSESSQWIALFGMVAVALLFAVEVRRWRRLGALIGPRQRKVRAILVIAIELLFLMMLLGQWLAESRSPLIAIIYWLFCLFLGLLVVVLALVDLRAVFRQYLKLNQQLFRDLRQDDERKQ